MNLAIIFFVSVSILFLLTLNCRHIEFSNMFPYVFFGYILLYTGTCFIAVFFNFYKIPSVTTLSLSIIDDYLFISGSSIFTFTLCMLFDRKIFRIQNFAFVENNSKLIYFLMYIILYPIALYFSSISNWTNGSRMGLIDSLAAYLRNIITVLSIIFFSYKSSKFKFKLFLLFLFLVLTFRSTQRTNFFIVSVAFIYTIRSSRKAFICGLFAVLLLLVVGSVRNNVSFSNLIYPIFGEGIFGSWGTLNAMEYLRNNSYDTSNILYLFNGFLNFFLKFFHIHLPEVSDCLAVEEINYYPMGGFFFLSDSILWNPLFGPIVYTIIIYFIYQQSYRLYLKKMIPKSLLLLGLLFELIKASSTTFAAMLVFHLLFLFFVNIFTKFICLSCNKKNAWRFYYVR